MAAVLWSLLSLGLFIAISQTSAAIHLQQKSNCACKDANLCRPVAKKNRWEVVGYSFGPGQQVYELFDWNRLTTIVVDGNVRPSFLCFAHSKGVKVHTMAVPKRGDFLTERARVQYVNQLISLVKSSHLDGINIDFEGAASRNGLIYNGLTNIMFKLREGLRSINTSLELTIAYRYCPSCDGDFVYDVAKIKQVVDYFVIMDHDLQGIAYETTRKIERAPYSNKQACLTSLYLSDSPLPLVLMGAKTFQRVVPGRQLVMALPWYGRRNHCLKFNAATSECYVLCSERFSKHELNYKMIMHILRAKSEQGRKWNKFTSTPTFTYFVRGQRYQVNYDDPVSLRLKWQSALKMGFRGAGIWNIDMLDYSSNSKASADRKDMWDAIPFH